MTWERSGDEFLLSWGERSWALGLGDSPGLRCVDAELSYSVLTLGGVSVRGRSRPNAFVPECLLEVTHFGDVVQAAYAPPDMGGLRVRARWSISSVEEAVDLEVEVAATSVGEIFELEVGVRSQVLPVGGEHPLAWNAWIAPRDARTAGFSYDGREPSSLLRSASTLPVPSRDKAAFLPRVFRPGTPADSPRYYFEMVQPNDCSRRLIFEATGAGASRRRAMATRYELFGHDLEKGVVLRGRLRGLWRTTEIPDALAVSCLDQFSSEPLPLGP